MLSVCLLFNVTITVMKHHFQSNLGKNNLFHSQFHVRVNQLGQELEQGRDLDVGADAETTEEYCLLACFSRLSQLLFLQNPGISA